MSNTEPKTLQAAILYFADPDNCISYLVARRWSDGVVSCPTCGSDKVAYVASRRVWQCKTRHAKAQFSIKVGTIFEDSPIALDKWLMAMWMLANCKNGVSSWEIHRTLGITQKSAWFMLHRIRLALGEKPEHKMGGPDGGPVEVDESFVGGDPKNWHLSKRGKRKRFTDPEVKIKSEKTAVVGLLDRDAREVRAKVVPNVNRETLQNEILAQIESRATIYTDGWKGYSDLQRQEFIHETVNHVEEYVRGDVHTNGLENFWALMKRSLKGTYVCVEAYHLDRYVTEQVFRYNNRNTKKRPMDDGDRFSLAVTQILGKRLTYAELTGKDQARQF
jgi:transposase-like protein